MRILYVGNYKHSWCTEVHLAREMEGLGHAVDRFQEPPGGGNQQTLRQIEQRAEGCDLVMWTRTWGLPKEATELWRRLEAKGTATASYHLDLYVGLARERHVAADPFWTTGHVFTPDGDPVSADWFADRGINHVWCPPAIVSDECTRGTVRPEFEHDVVFVGSAARSYHPEWPHRRDLLDWLAATYGDRFHRYGVPDSVVRGQDLNDLYASAKVVVGDSLCPPGHTRYWSDRVYETVGRGGFLIHPRVPGLEEHFDDGQHLLFYDYGDFARLRGLIDEALVDDYGRVAVTHAGMEHVRAHHTYRHRLDAALRVIAFGRPAPTIRLELGSGYHPTPGFTHLDLNPAAPDVDIVGPAFPLPDLKDGTVAELRAVDVLEHLSYRDTAAALAEWARVLRPGGRLYVQVPDADLIMRWYVEAPEQLVNRLPADLPQTPMAGAAWRLLGGHADGEYVEDGGDFRLNAHFALFSTESLSRALIDAGLAIESIETNGHPNLLAWAVKP